VHTQDGSALGTPAYMSPEQAMGEGSDSRADIYALGVTLHKMLAGSLPFDGDLESVIARKLTGEPTPLSQLNDRVPEELSQLVARMLRKDPGRRPESMEAVAASLRAFSFSSAG
jgi:serine/threonine-protein kinase